MADKGNLQRCEKAVSVLETGLETLKTYVNDNKTKLLSMEDKLNQMVVSNDEMKKGFQDLCDFLKKDPPDKDTTTSPPLGTLLGTGDNANTQMILRSPNPGIISHQAQTPTQFGTIHDNMIVDDFGRIMNMNTSTQMGSQSHESTARTRTSTQPPKTQIFTAPLFTQQPTPPLSFDGGLNTFQPSYTAPYMSLPPPYPFPRSQPPPHFTHTVHQNNHQPYTPNTWFTNESIPNRNHYSSFKTPKVDFSKFEGNDPRAWIGKCEKYFQLNPTLDDRSKVICATLYLEGEADVWYRSLEEEKPALLWSEFVEMVCNRFSKVGYENLVGQFNKLVQKGRVEEYITQFDELKSYVMAQEGHHRESYYIDTFISGLKEELAQQLYNNMPSTLQEARNMAKGQEYLLNVLDKRYKSSVKQNTGLTSFKQGYSTVKNYSPGGATKEGDKSVQGDSRKLTIDELNEKRRNGLYFNCDEKFVPGHNCRKKKLYVILDDDQGEESEDKTEELAIIWEEGVLTKSTIEEADATISLNAIRGAQGNHTLNYLVNSEPRI